MTSRKKPARKAYGAVYKDQNTIHKSTLKKSDIKQIDIGNGKYRYVSKRKHDQGKKNPWIKAVQTARDSLGITGFVILNKGEDGQNLYKTAKK